MKDLLAALPPWLPWVVVAMVAVALIWLLRNVGGLFGRQVDPQRLFNSAQKTAGRRLCGNRCENKPPFWFRCKGAAEHADHIYPHSRGGATAMSNLQFLCAPCNLHKSAKIPSALYIWRLEHRRRKYFPPHADTRVEWRLGKANDAVLAERVPRVA